VKSQLSRLFSSLIALIATSSLTGCIASEPEKPGDVSNPKLAEMFQKAFEKEIAGMNPTWKPGLRPGSDLLAKGWLSQIREISSQCKFGPDNLTKFNRLEYLVRLKNGETITNVYSGLLCQYQPGFGKPLISIVTLENGRVINAKTDGRERDQPVSYANEWVNNLAEIILGIDQTRRSTLYFGTANSKEQNRKEWNK
jgi:hypothetical protein